MNFDISYEFIELGDGTRLAAKIWLPKDARSHPAPAILEYIPYRWSDGTVDLDNALYPAFAEKGYVGVRVDIRGTGNSSGSLKGEYLDLERQDAIQVINWIANQSWCDGSVGMMGYSWGGINSLQLACEDVPALKAVISVCSSNDLYREDVHYRGGSPTMENVTWNANMLANCAAPPDPATVGDRWRDIWEERLHDAEPWMFDWLRCQRDGPVYDALSKAKDPSALKVPVLAIGGWADLYKNTVLRLCEAPSGTVKGIVGPWAHGYPHITPPGPGIDFLSECIRWWDKWLRGRETGVEDDPALRYFVHTDRTAGKPEEGAQGRWDACQPGDFVIREYSLERGAAFAGGSIATVTAEFDFARETGRLCPFGFPDEFPKPRDLTAARPQIFWCAPEGIGTTFLGRPRVRLRVKSEQPSAQISVELREVDAKGRNALVSHSILNLSHRDGHTNPKMVPVDRWFDVEIELDAIGHYQPAGNRFAVVVSDHCFPNTWPTPHRSNLQLDAAHSTLSLPLPIASSTDWPGFPEDGAAPETPATDPMPAPLREEAWTEHAARWEVGRSFQTCLQGGEGHGDWTVTERFDDQFWVNKNRPSEAAVKATATKTFTRGDWSCEIVAESKVTSDMSFFDLDSRIHATYNDEVIFEKTWQSRLPRDFT